MLSPGEIFGKYKIINVLGRGGMGTVYKALDSELGRTVALKIVNENLSKSEEYRSKLAAEAKKSAQLNSPYVVKVFEYAEIDDRPYISLEYVEGDDLRSVIESDDYDIDKKLELSLKIARGIKSAHQNNVIHRDLKPENIKVTPAGDTKILDFGLAVEVTPGEAVDSSGNVEGTVAYASPEQLSGEPATSSSDLFSFGVVLFELFTGERPFGGDYTASSIYSTLYEDPENPSEINREVPDWLSDFIIKLLQKKPDDRFEDIDATLAYLEKFAASGDSKSTLAVNKKQKSVTVLDLKNRSGDESWGYFCEGFTDDVINELKQRTDLVVSPQPDTEIPRDIEEVFNRCRTDFVITGSLMKWKERIQLTLAIHSNGGKELIASKKHEGSGDELFDILSRAASDVAQVLSEVTGSPAKELTVSETPDISAYDFYLKGRNYYKTNRQEDLLFAADMFKKAISVDSKMALAHTGLADVYAFQYMAFYDRSPQTILAAKLEAEKAMEINPTLPEAHRSLGRYYMFTGKNKEAEKSLMTAVKHDPKYAIGYRTLGWFKLSEGSLEDALNWSRKALELAPTDLETLLLLSLVHMDSRKYTLAMATLQRAVELGPDYGRAYYNLGDVYMKLGVSDLALDNFLLGIKYQGDPNCFIDAGYVYILQGDYDIAKEMFKQSIEQGQLTFAAHYYLGLCEQLEGNEAAAQVQYENVLKIAEQQGNKEEQNEHLLAFKTLALASMGQEDKALELANRFKIGDIVNGEVLYSFSKAYAVIGEVEKSREFLHESFLRHDGPTEKEARLDPHFRTILD